MRPIEIYMTRGKKYYWKHKKEMLERSKRYNKSNQFEFANSRGLKSTQFEYVDRTKAFGSNREHYLEYFKQYRIRKALGEDTKHIIRSL